MQSSHLARAGALAAFAAVALMGPALAQNAVTVTVNGAPVNLNPPPTERAGRVFVPLRGVFENLGATVVYANGTINATGRGHTISLHIGSQQAIVDGQNQMVDVAPFIIGASTYVPLRFVSQALGASVNYDGSNNVVAINVSGRGNPPPQVYVPPHDTAVATGALAVIDVLPRPDASAGDHPTIQAKFEHGRADPNSVHVILDGRDVTSNAYVSDHDVNYTPQDLPPGRHDIRLYGRDADGGRFDRRWSFTSGS